MPVIDPAEFHDQAIVIDGVCPLLMDRGNVGWYIDGGLTAQSPIGG